MSRRVRVHLRGPLAAFHDGPIEIVAATAWEAIEAVTLQLPGFKPDPVSGRKRIQAVGYDTIEALKQPLDRDDIYILPAMSFGKKGGIIQTIIGAALITAGLLLPAGPWTAPLISIGASMAIGGIMKLLSPVPQINSSNADSVRSKYLPSNQNTVKIGTTIPLLYGRRRVGGQIMSIQIASNGIGSTTSPTVTPTSGGGGGGGGGVGGGQITVNQ